MSRVREFKLPDLGEGLTEGEILKWLVSPGDTVKINDPIVEVETAKAAVEVPSPYAGQVLQLFHGEGTTVDVGSPIISFDTDPSAGPLPESGTAPVVDPADAARSALQTELSGAAGAEEEIEEGKIGGKTSSGRTAVLVGYGIKETFAERRPRKDAPPAPAGVAVPAAPAQAPARVSAARVAEHAADVSGAVGVLAKPPVRKRAKDLGVDLSRVTGTGPNGTITRTDVESYAADGAGAAVVGSDGSYAGGAGAAVSAPRRTAGERTETRLPIKGVRKLTAQNMVASAFTAPHVTEFMTVDVTPMMELVAQLKALPDFAGIKVTPMTVVAKAVLAAVKRNPEINATWDEAAGEIVVKHYVNLGIAAATPRGLMVPNIKDADTLSLVELAGALADLTTTARDGKTQPADMAGGTITITNVGTFGVDNGTPIINPGESAIVCFGAVRDMPWVHQGQIAVRKVTQLALSFDHRNVDGQLGSQFLSDIGNALAEPARLLAWS